MLEIQEQCVLLDLEATSKEGVLRELTAAVQEWCPGVDQATLLDILLEREHVGSTGVGNGVAIPHGKVPDLDDILLCFGSSRSGISFDAVDNQPVYLFVMILSPETMAEEYLRTLGQVSRLLKNPETRSRLMRAEDCRAIQQIFSQDLRER
ncbi:PTS fructose transporter subunit IIA [Desulfolithobacter dissulfuricans]|uniref:PTS fructose transporter subunit IIA n=1 Tax=Desulfolithobacter dissulfuricans TaxID=2795293 RepID=A0A915XL22_9BACT|nr:PTS sugar transporter subunit IIA [Desulfolithobacter dissulfuricans]BCO10797.1 PTS fructose transporter subunit IIA [Desulfolithobacter dissulfuricans]